MKNMEEVTEHSHLVRAFEANRKARAGPAMAGRVAFQGAVSEEASVNHMWGEQYL